MWLILSLRYLSQRENFQFLGVPYLVLMKTSAVRKTVAEASGICPKRYHFADFSVKVLAASAPPRGCSLRNAKVWSRSLLKNWSFGMWQLRGSSTHLCYHFPRPCSLCLAQNTWHRLQNYLILQECPERRGKSHSHTPLDSIASTDPCPPSMSP